MDHTRDVIKSQMAELKDLMKEIAALDTELNSAAPHKRIELCLDMMEKTSRVNTLKEDTQRKIDTMDVHRKKTLVGQAIIDSRNTKKTETSTSGTAGTTRK
ncbi:unnamed protein product [Penicillium palitans]